MAKKIWLGICSFVLAGAVGFFGVQFVTKTGVFKIPGELIFAENFPETEAEEIRALFEVPEGEKKIVLDQNLTLHKTWEDEQLTKDNYYLREIYVPTADFYSVETTISAEELRTKFESGDASIVPVGELDSSMKLLAVDDAYYLEDFARGALFEYLVVEGESAEDLALFNELITSTLAEFPERETTLTMAQTGVTALSRRMNGKLAQVDGGAYFAASIGDFLKRFDLTHTSNESSFTDYATTANICSKWGFVDTLTAIGLDIVELTGNHNVDCGATAAIETIDKYEELGIKTVGGGRNAAEAAVPLEIAQKGTNIKLATIYLAIVVHNILTWQIFFELFPQ